MGAVEVNDSMVEREQLGMTQLSEGDRLEFLFYMGGGR
jgi:sulfur carrier protein